MLYWLSAFSDTIGPLNVLRYIMFRTGGAMVTAIALVFLLGPIITAVLRSRQGQPIRPAGPIILLAMLVAILLWANPANRYVLIVLGVTLTLGVIGFYREATRQSAIPDIPRIAIAAGVAAAACIAFVFLSRAPNTTSIGFPFRKEFAADLGWFYILVGAFIIIAAGNIVNLADRLFGFVLGPLEIVAASFLLIAYFAGNSILAEYLGVRYVPGTGELAVLCGAMIGAGLGFLSFNSSPGSTFLGDTGSLALGSMFGAVAVATKHEIVLALICCLFVLKPTPSQG